MNSAIEKILARIGPHRSAFLAVLAMGIKASGSLLTLVIFAIAARALTPDDFGRLSVWFNAMSFLAVAAVFGQDTLIARSFGEYAGRSDFAQAWGAYFYGWRRTLISVGVFMAGTYLLAPVVYPNIARDALLAALFFLLTQTLLHYSSHSSRAITNFAVSEINRETVWRGLLLIVVIWTVTHQGPTPTEFFLAAGAGQALALAFQLYFVCKAYKARAIANPREDDALHWRSRGQAMWQSAIVEAATAYFDVMLLGYFTSPAIAGDYFAAARIANIFLLVASGVNIYSFAHCSNLYFSGQIEKLQDMLRSLVAAVLAISTPFLILIVIFGDTVLKIFGPHYVEVYSTVIALTLGTYVMSTCGTPGVILLTTGHEKIYSRIITAATFIRMIFIVGIGMKFGAFGAAIGWALVNAPLALLLAALCRRKLGVDPSILSLLHRRPVRREAVREVVAQN
jgi:O-antigen/teichoic acid export membrane protein